MQIVIDISVEDYANIEPFLNGETIKGGFNLFKILEIIKNGTPLPKGHGDLVDRDAINERFYSIYDDAMNCSNQPSDKYLLDNWSMCLDTAPATIEADKAESEGKE